MQFPPGNFSLQPVAIGAVVEVTILPKPPMERVVLRPREQAGRNASERRAGLEKFNVGADPALVWGRPPTRGYPGERVYPLPRSHRGNGDGMSAEGIGHNTGNPRRWERVTPNRTPVRDRPGHLG